MRNSLISKKKHMLHSARRYIRLDGRKAEAWNNMDEVARFPAREEIARPVVGSIEMPIRSMVVIIFYEKLAIIRQ